MDNLEGNFIYTSSSNLDPQEWNGDWNLNGQKKGYWTGRCVGSSEFRNALTPVWTNAEGCVQYGPWQKVPAKRNHIACAAFRRRAPVSDLITRRILHGSTGTIRVLQKFWCACTTGESPGFWLPESYNGQDSILNAQSKGSDLGSTMFSGPRVNGAKFQSECNHQGRRRSSITIDDAPTDLPA